MTGKADSYRIFDPAGGVQLEAAVLEQLRDVFRAPAMVADVVAKAVDSSSYVSRMVNLNTLAPDIVTTVLDETLPPEVTLFELAVDPPALWEEQRGRMAR